ncbi:MAG: hypothetical protein ACR2PQ_11320 [Myxococcota bacterium]
MARYWLVAGVLAVAFVVWRSVARRTPQASRPEHALILTLRLADESTSQAEVHARLEHADRVLRAAIEGARLGEIEEPVAAGVDCVYTCYGEDADRLFDAAEAGLRDVPCLPGSHAIRRFGPPGAPEERTEFRNGDGL